MRTPTRKNDASTQAAPSAPSFDELMARVDAASAAIATPDPLTKSADASTFAAYVAEQIEKSKGETPELATKRLAALKDTTALVRAAFESGQSTVTFKAYEHEAAPTTPATESTGTTPAPTEGAAAPEAGSATDTAKRFVALVKQIGDESSPLRKAVAEQKPELIAKASAASGFLDRIAAMFGITRQPDDDGDYRSIRWDVCDAICVLERVEEADRVMSTLQASLGVTMAAKNDATPAGGESTDVTKNANRIDFDAEVPAGAATDEFGFAHDMSALVRTKKAADKPAAPAAEDWSF